MKLKRAALTLAGVTAFLLSSTACARFTEEWNDAPIERKDDSPAVVYSMPDGFANVASKCDGNGFRFFTTRGAESGGGKAVAVIADPSCKTR
ncbi:hypothetical protein [Streptomyces sp. CFMR 7]|uniref:hypothetical protein n=1 Tax=Streptomyces sp. CFMR 7 TaxID=1649184 RepID=UPI0011A8B71C|nr:hypothetical protein [Streptomyces sp. CFMR 7]